MEQLFEQSFLQILQDDLPGTFENTSVTDLQSSSIKWDDEESFEINEVPNGASADINLAEALRSICAENANFQLQAQNEPGTTVKTGLNRELSLKEELKAKIQTRRLSQGVGEMRVQFEPPKSYPLSPEESAKVQKRKHRNRESANKSRIKRKIHEESLCEEIRNLEKEHDQLVSEINLLRKVKETMKLKLSNHQCGRQKVTSSCERQKVTSSSSSVAGATLNTRTSRENNYVRGLARQKTAPNFTITLSS